MKTFFVKCLLATTFFVSCLADEFHSAPRQIPVIQIDTFSQQQVPQLPISKCDAYKHRNDAYVSLDGRVTHK